MTIGSAAHSRLVTRVRRRWPQGLHLLPAGPIDRDIIDVLIAQLHAGGGTLESTLRVARHLVLERLAVMDTEQGVPLDSVMLAMTHLAEATLEHALTAARRDGDQRFGVPRDEQGEPIEFWIVGMGKLGARELNVSSDVDLVYAYESEGQTDGARSVSAHEYFSFVARRLQTLIGDVTEDGFVFRVDLALRPNGNSGPPVCSLGMLESYFLLQGREWERFAWLKSRIVAPRASLAGAGAKALKGLVTPFVYRRYLDYGIFESLRQLHRKIREEAQRRAAGRPERANDVKLSRGGIREIEFIVQLLQVVRGGHFPELRTRSTLRALERLALHGLIKPETAGQLAQAYVFLRRIEHRIHFLDDEQTHLLPTDDDDLRWIASTLGFQGTDPVCAMLRRLGDTRELVANEFDALLHDGRSTPASPVSCKGCSTEVPALDSDALTDALPTALKARVRLWAASPKIQSLRDDSRLRLAQLVQRLGQHVDDGSATPDAALRFIDWLEPLLRRENYLALLVERPAVQQRLLRLLGLARWPMRYLMLHPGVIDELADDRLLHGRFDRDAFAADLEQRHAAWQRADDAGEESLLDGLRHAHHAEVFRTLVRDVERHLDVEDVADDLSSLADVTLDCCIRWAWGHLKQAHRPWPRVAVIAYGKLGGKELGYGSDLDIVFLYDDDDERAGEVYGIFVRKLIQWLTLRTRSGELFDIDTALRPNGNSGLLVTSMASFDQYQRGRGSNTAWTWEHQAITRARWCAGDAALASRFEAVRRDVLCAPRDHAALRAEIMSMRDKVRQAKPVAGGLFDVKHSQGGMMDAEFAVQHLVLAHATAHPPLQANVGNIALLQRAEQVGLLKPGVGVAAADAYRELRRAQHRARLDERPTTFDLDTASTLHQARSAVLTLWRDVFG